MWTMREHAYEVASASWPPYDAIISTNPSAYWDFTDATSLRTSGAVPPTSSGVTVTPQDKTANAYHLSQWNVLPTWFTGMQNGRSGGSFGGSTQIFRSTGPSIFTSLHRAQTTIIFVFWPGAQGTTVTPETNQTVLSTSGQTAPSLSGTGFQINYLNASFSGPASAISYLSATGSGTAAALATTPSNSVPKTRFSIITVVTDIANAVANERVKIYIDGGGTTYAGNTATASAYQFGPSNFFMGSGGSSSFRMGQCVFWESILPATTLNAIHSSLGDFWGIPVTSFS
jgi:hypothetical protein